MKLRVNTDVDSLTCRLVIVMLMQLVYVWLSQY